MKTFYFFFGYHLSQCLFAHTDNISKSLQSKGISATTGRNLAGLTVKALESIRNDDSFNLFYDVILKKVKEYPSVSEPILPRKRCAPLRYQVETSEHIIEAQLETTTEDNTLKQ